MQLINQSNFQDDIFTWKNDCTNATLTYEFLWKHHVTYLQKSMLGFILYHWISLLYSYFSMWFVSQRTWQWCQRGKQAEVSAAAAADGVPQFRPDMYCDPVLAAVQCTVFPTSQPQAEHLPQSLKFHWPAAFQQHPAPLCLTRSKVQHCQQGLPSQHALLLRCPIFWKMMDYGHS